MKTVVLDVRASSEAMADFVRVWKTGKDARTWSRIVCCASPVFSEFTMQLAVKQWKSMACQISCRFFAQSVV